MENAIPQVQIMAEILGFCKHPQTKAQMMHNVDFSLDMLKKYLHFLGTQELLEIHYSREEYLTTQKGLNFVKEWKEMVKLL